MKNILIKGRGAFPGVAEGIAIVFPNSISGNTGGVGDKDGIIYEKGNINRGMSINGSIIVTPCGKGSLGFSAHFKSAKISGFSSAGWIVSKMDSRIASAIASLQLPCVCDFEDVDPLSIIKSGDYVKIDGSRGIIEIIKE